MPRPGRPTSLTIAAAALALLAAPAAAQAASYTVQAGGGACAAPGDLQCGSLTDAATAVSPGDTVTVAPATYNESPNFIDANVTITGGGPGVFVTGAITFNAAAAGAASVLEKVVVLNLAGSAPAVTVNAPSGLMLRDAVVVSGGGAGVSITAGNNSIIRSQVFGGGGGASAVDVSSIATPLTTTLDSSILAGAGPGTGLKVKTNNNGILPGTAANATVNARHVTIAGSSSGMLLDSSNAFTLTAPTVGNITVNATDSIVQGTIEKLYTALLTPNIPTTNFTRTNQGSPSADLFVNPGARNFHLRSGAPVIDQGAITPGESTTDVDGDARTVGPASDLGADEFTGAAVTKPPVTTPPGVTTDGTAPAVTITKPKKSQKINLITKKTRTVTKNGVKRKVTTKKRTRIKFAGRATDASGVQSVLLTVEKISSPAKTTVAQGSAASTKKCTWLDPSKGLRKTLCSKPITIRAKLAGDGTWTYTVASAIKLSAGGYRAIAYGVDKTGSFGNSAPTSRRNIRFTLK